MDGRTSMGTGMGTGTGSGSIDRMRAGLTASAVVLAALVGLQASRLPSAAGPEWTAAAKADQISLKVGDQSMLSFNGGNEDVVVVLDSRAEQLLTYRIRQQQQFEQLGAYSIPEMFVTAQRLGIGGPGRGR